MTASRALQKFFWVQSMLVTNGKTEILVKIPQEGFAYAY
jgi:hypothetical protein